jgi:hypothetical protein
VPFLIATAAIPLVSLLLMALARVESAWAPQERPTPDR